MDFGQVNPAHDKFLTAYEALQVGGKFEVKTFDPAREDTGWNLAAAKAIDISKREFGTTGRQYNIAVLPAEGQGMYVYLYPAQTQVDVYPFGSDVRYLVSADGAKIIEKRQMHKSILEVSLAARKDMTADYGYHTHILSELPEDTDVFLVLTRKPRIPEMVSAGAYIFRIDVSGKITMENRPRRRGSPTTE